MSFLNLPLLGWLAPLVGVPLLIHLLNKRFPRTFRFSAVEHIKKSMAQRSKLFRLRHLILAALRTLAILLLLLMFLKPVREMFGSNHLEHGPRHVVILLDHSLSMEAKDAGMSGRKRGVIEAEKIINTLAPDDLVDVIAVERAPAPCFPDFTSNQSEVLSFLYSLAPGLGTADFSKAGALAADLFSRAPRRQEIYFISDFQRSSWATADLAKLPGEARVFFVNAAPDGRSNRAILGARLKQAAALPGETVMVEITLGNFSEEAFAGKVEARVDKKVGAETEASVAPWTIATVDLPVRLGGAGLHTIELTIPEDDLPQDNHWFLSTSAMEKENVAVVSDETGSGEKRASFFLSKALDPFETQGGSIRAKHLNSAQLTGAELSATSKVFLTSLDKLNEETCKALARFINGGGSVVYFLDGKFDAENLAALDKAAGEALAPLHLESRQDGQNIPGGAQQILRGDFKSKFLRVFRGSERGNLALMEFYEFYHATLAGKGKALLTYADGSPALAVSSAGMGTLLTCNFSVNELASNMARQRSFPAWIQDLVKSLGNEDNTEKGNEVGDEILAEVWKTEMSDQSVQAPSGLSIRTNREADVNRYHISFTAQEQGIYTLAEGSSAYAWAVNVPTDESDLRAVDTATLPQRLAEGQQTQAHFIEGQRDYQFLNKGRPLYHYFALGMLALLVVELGLFKLFKRLAA